MKTLRGMTTCVVAALVSGCVTTPNLVDESVAGITPTHASGILIVVDGKIFDSPSFGSEGRAYLAGLGEGIQGTLTDIPTQLVELDVMKFVDPIPHALDAMHPSHLVRLYTASDLRRNDTPVSATWQMTVSDVKMTPVAPTDEKPAGTRYTFKPIYKARADGDTCVDSDSLAKQCGAAMGKILGDALRAAHVMQIGAGT
ncbi:hypothetical protein [Burkholderia aenigmatica]|nr:hypothetical protein [Burkholderia aenigmatica]